jgi:hypothetical protein
MKNLAVVPNRTKLFARRSICMLFVLTALAVSTLAQGVDSKNTTSDHGNIVRLVTPQKESTTIKGPAVEATGPDVLLARQGAPWCYVANVGRFPMLVALPPGVSCVVSLPPYVYYGVTGY